MKAHAYPRDGMCLKDLPLLGKENIAPSSCSQVLQNADEGP